MLLKILIIRNVINNNIYFIILFKYLNRNVIKKSDVKWHQKFWFLIDLILALISGLVNNNLTISTFSLSMALYNGALLKFKKKFHLTIWV